MVLTNPRPAAGWRGPRHLPAPRRQDNEEPPRPAPSDVARAFWRELDLLRRGRGLSYQRLARRTKIPHSTLQYWMTRRRRLPSWSHVQALVAALEGSETDWLRRWKQADGATAGRQPTGEAPLGPHARQEPGDDLVAEPGPAPAAQAQLPMDIMEFTGRRNEISLLWNLLDLSPRGRSPTAVIVAAIEGMAGVGKTRLAVHVAHELLRAGRGDEIQLYIDLGGHAAARRPADPAAVLEELLRLLGVPGRQIPRGLTARSTLYRDRLHGKRGIVLLDNAADEDQVRPLLPGSPSCLVIITSRRKLNALDGVRPLTLTEFDTHEALSLLTTIVGEQRARAEPQAARDIVQACGRQPLAVALASRRLRARPTWSLTDLATRLRVQTRRLTELSVRTRAVGAAFAVSYEPLPPDQRRVFRLLALHPGNDFTAASVAALAAVSVDTAENVLEALLDEHLLEQTTPGRYRFHDLVQAYARERVATEEPVGERAAAVRRLLTWYLHTADQADRALTPHRQRLALPSLAGARPLTFPGHREALRWCEAEWGNLVTATHAAATREWHEITWQLPTVLYGFFHLRKHWDDWIETHRTALTATRRLADRTAEARVLNGLGIAYAECRRFAEALDCFHAALITWRELGDRPGEAQVHNNLGETYRRLDQVPTAIDHHTRDLAICQETDDQHGTAISLNNLGKALLATGRRDDAIQRLREALTISQRVGDQQSASETLNDLGDAYRGLRQLPDAVAHYRQALTIRRDIGDLHGEAETLHNLGEAHYAQGAADAALHCYRQALAVWNNVGDRWAKALTVERIRALRE